MTPPPLPNRDREQLKLLATFHYVIAGLDILFIAPAVLHYWLMSTMFANPGMWENAKSPPPFDPQAFFRMTIWVYVVWVGMQVASAVLNFLSGRYLQAQKNRTFSVVAAGIGCLHIPLGTILGIFTLNVLSRASVVQLYAAKNPLPATGLPPPLPNPEADHLRLLTIFHYVYSGLCLLGGAVTIFQFFMMRQFFASMTAMEKSEQARSEQIFAVVGWIVIGFGVFYLACALLNFCSGRLLRKQRGQIFCKVVAALNCLMLPVGTVLGVFTFIILSRPGVARLYSSLDATSGGASASSSL